MRLVIDYDLCCGNGRCYALFPQLFTDDDRGYGRVIGDGAVDEALAGEAKMAVTTCPERAIAVEGEGREP